MILFGATAAAVLLLDALSKYIVAANMQLNQNIPLIPGIFDLTFIRNNGAAWGILAGKQMLLAVFTAVLMIAVLVYAFVGRKKLSKLEMVSLAMIFGGGLGNFISRVFAGSVVDFFNIHIIPIFNIADIGITLGCALLIIAVIFFEDKSSSEKTGDANGKD